MLGSMRQPPMPGHAPAPVVSLCALRTTAMRCRALARGRIAIVALGLAACMPAEGTRGWECIAPANAGGGWDLTCRSVGQVLRELDLSPGLVRTTNMPGAGGGVAFAHAVAQRSGDPTLLVAASPSTTLRLAQGQYGSLAAEDVRWVGAVGAEYGVLAVAAEAPWRSLDDLLAAWRKEPSAVVVSGGSAVDGQDHMKVLLLVHRAGIDPKGIRYVPFDGGGEAMTALLGGFVDVFSGEASEVLGQVAAGRMRVLAVLSPERLSGPLAAVQTAHESGVDVDWVTWRGFYVPGGISDERYAEWVRVIKQVAASPEWQAARQANRLHPFSIAGEEFDAFVQQQIEDFREMSRELGLLR